MRSGMKPYMEPIVKPISETGVRVGSKIVKTDTSAVNAICNTANDEAADLIVMGQQV